MEVRPSTSRNAPRMSYDVFISFRGEDTRNAFVGFLYEKLHKLGIMTFMDDKKLSIGDSLNEELVKAIEESRSSIVVLSINYASSKWCLRELAKIIDKMEKTTHRVLPVFYHVDPSDVRHQSGSFQKNFDEHEKAADKFVGEQKEKFLEEVQNWKESMTKISNITGEVVTKYSSEVDVVNKITDQIFDRWRPKPVIDKNLVGITNSLKQMSELLSLGFDDVRFIGMVGMSGIGKTTIAKVVFYQIQSKFEDKCFLSVSGGSSEQSNLVSIQKKLLSRLFSKENIEIDDEDYGAEIIRKRVCGRKILLVLDDVKEEKQLKMLAGSLDWFGPGSRVIITTRNKQVLHKRCGILEYNVKLLDANSALQLFQKHACGIDYKDMNFMNLSMKIIEKLGGLPLALKVMGSYLNEQKEVIWKETLNRLIKVDEENFFEVLKISYDGLGAKSQKVFLDLTCFFHGRRKVEVIKILESFGYAPHSELQLFMERCLIEDSRTKILMHDLIVALGQEIVHRESLTKSSKQSRIWLQEDLVHAFTMRRGLKYTEGIVLRLEKKQKEFTLEAKLFASMTCLRILEISNVQLSGNIKFLSNLLGLLNWPGYPSKCLPANFHSAYLLELHLPCSSIVRLWEGQKEFEKLKVIDVSGSEYLLETPDFSKVPNLERLILRQCRRLHHIHPSINSLDHLIFLDLNECSGLKSFPSNLRYKNLKHLILSKSSVTSSLEIIRGNTEHLCELLLEETPIEQLHSSIERLVGLVVLDLRNCSKLSSLPNEIGNLKSLETLRLEGCVNLGQIPPSLGNVQCLEYLEIGKTSIRDIPPTIHCLKNLKALNCDGLSRNIWTSLLPPCNIVGSNLGISGLKSLEILSVRGCNFEYEDIPEDLHYFSSLKILDLSSNNFVRLPESINHLKNLRELKLHDCFNLQQLPNLATNLQPILSYTKFRMPVRSFPSPYQRDEHFILEFIPQTNLKLDPEAFEDSILKGDLFSSTDDKAKLIELFDVTREGNLIEIEWENDANNIYGVVLSACIQCSQNTAHEEISIFYSKFFIELEMQENPMTGILPLTSKLTSRTRFWMLYIPRHMLPQCRLCFKIVAKGSWPSIDVQKCGATILSYQNAPNFLRNMFNTIYRSPNQNKFYIIIKESTHESKCSCDEPETVHQYCSTQYVENESDSFCSVKKNQLESYLQRVHEEEKHHTQFYFFPQGQVSSWFRIQQPNETVAVKIPLNLFREKKWMGLAVFSIFSIHENSEFFHKYALNFQISSNEDGRHLREGRPLASKSFFIPLQLLQFSPQILFVSFVPRYVFPYVQDGLNHFYVNFITNAEILLVESCGARLVYQHNVEGLIHTIIDCVLKSGQEQYQNYSQRVMKDLLTTYRQVSTADQPTTCTPSDPDGDLSNEELMHENFQHPPSWKKIQEWKKCSKFDTIFRGKEILSYFTSQSRGNEVTIRIPERLYFTKNEVVVLLCSVVAINKKIEKSDRTSEAQSRVIVLDLKCEFGVDSHAVEPKHHLFVPAERALSQYAPSFIWFSSRPFAEFDALPWTSCNYLRCKVSTNDEELFHVQQCGLHLL